jgi:hypothetical protein
MEVVLSRILLLPGFPSGFLFQVALIVVGRKIPKQLFYFLLSLLCLAVFFSSKEEIILKQYGQGVCFFRDNDYKIKIAHP